MFNEEELKLIKSCLLSAKEFLRHVRFKDKDMKNKIFQIDNLLEKFKGV